MQLSELKVNESLVKYPERIYKAFSAHLDTRTNRVVICSTEDNLIKGAGGQAVQSFNICEGLDETAGLL